MKTRTKLILISAILTLCLILSLSCSIFKTKATIIINEIATQNVNCLPAKDADISGWIELHNTSSNDMDIMGYTLVRDGDSSSAFTFPETVIASGGYILVTAGASACKDYLFSGFSTDGKPVSFTLKNNSGDTLCSVDVPELPVDVSYCSGEGSSWRFCFTPTPGVENVGPFYTTLAEFDNHPSSSLLLNEATRDWAEIYNSGKKSLVLSDYFLSDDMSDTTKWQFPSDKIEPGEYITVSLGRGDKSCSYEASFKIRNDESAIYLCSAHSVITTLYFPNNVTTLSVGMNDEQVPAYFINPTPGAQNTGAYALADEQGTITADSPLIINELQLRNRTTLIDSSGARPAWAELYAREAVDLGVYALSDDPAELDKWRLSDVSALKDKAFDGGYMLIYLTGAGELATSEGVHSTFKLGDDEAFYLTDLSKMSTQCVAFDATCMTDDVSYGLKDGEWVYFGKATPMAANTTKGFSGVDDKGNLSTINTSNFYISEVCSTHPARSGELDWIELYNPTDDSINLDGYYLSNTKDKPFLFKLKGRVSAHDYYVIYATDNVTKQNASTAPFGISTSGEKLLICDSRGYAVDYFDTGALRVNLTSGRAHGNDSGARAFFSTPTRGNSNSSPTYLRVTTPVITTAGGFYTTAQTVKIVCTTPDAVIYYTTDGTKPTDASSRYTGALTISENTPLQAIAVVDGRVSSDVCCATYLFDEKHTLPVVCLSIKKSDFSAVCSVVDKKMPIIERECAVEYYEADGTQGTSFRAGLRISGNGTRRYPQKSLNLYLRGAYGQSSVCYPFFENYDLTVFKSLTLRNAGQNGAHSRMTDAFSSMLVKGMNISYAETRFVILYVDGEYYGIYDLKENQNEDFFASRYNTDANLINTIRRNYLALSGSDKQIRQIYAMAQSMDMSVQSNFDEFTKYVDTDAYMDYIIARSYIGDTDLFNQKYVNSSDYKMRWRPVFYDLDYGFAFTGNPDTIGLYFTGASGIPSPDGSVSNMIVPTALKQNKAWREKFIKRYAECIKTQFSDAPELLEKMIAQLTPEMSRHIARWGSPNSLDLWQKRVNEMRSAVSKRNQQVKQQLRQYFDLTDAQMTELFG